MGSITYFILTGSMFTVECPFPRLASQQTCNNINLLTVRHSNFMLLLLYHLGYIIMAPDQPQ